MHLSAPKLFAQFYSAQGFCIQIIVLFYKLKVCRAFFGCKQYYFQDVFQIKMLSFLGYLESWLLFINILQNLTSCNLHRNSSMIKIIILFCKQKGQSLSLDANGTICRLYFKLSLFYFLAYFVSWLLFINIL